VVLARDLECRLDRLRPAADEEDAADVDGHELRERSASSRAGGVAKPTQLVKNGSSSSCFRAASVISGQGP
jgi:hypothetical protein